MFHAGLSPAALELEITESTILNEEDGTLDALKELNEMGISLAVDDFGTGYSSLSYLQKFPIDRVKIDRSFVNDLSTDIGQSLVGAIISMAHSLEIGVVAEGVETREQAEFLRERGCDELQGFLFSPAIPPCTSSGSWKKKSRSSPPWAMPGQRAPDPSFLGLSK